VIGAKKCFIDGKVFDSLRQASNYLGVSHRTVKTAIGELGISFSSEEFYKRNRSRPFVFQHKDKTYYVLAKAPIKKRCDFVKIVNSINWEEYIHEDEAKELLKGYFLNLKNLSIQTKYRNRLRHPYISNVYVRKEVANYKPIWAYDIVENGYGTLGGIFRLRWDELKLILPPFLSESKKYLQERRWIDYCIHSIIKIVWKYHKSEVEFLSKKEIRYGQKRLVYPCWKINSIIDEVKENGLDFYAEFNSKAKNAIYFNSESCQYRAFIG
jgi:hypothetical protein